MECLVRHLALGSFVLFCALAEAVAQTTFNVVQHHPSTLSYNGAYSIFEQPDGYLVFSRGWSLDSAVGATHVTKHDLEGNFLWLKEHRREFDVAIGFIDPVAEIAEGRYVASIMEFGDAGQIARSNYLYWFDAEGDTIRTRFFRSDSTSEGNIGSRQLVALPDGGFLNCGWCGDPINTGCITRLDSTGTILWERLYTNTSVIEQATPLADGGFILGGTRNGQVDKAVVMRTDSLGAVQWARYHGLYSITAGTKALATADGRILMAGDWNPDPAWSAYDRWASLYEYTPSGTFVGRKDYIYNRHALALHVLDKGDGHAWMVGSMFQYGVDPDALMLLWELDENLDSLWMRRYWYYEPDDAESFVYAVRSTSDGGLIMCGMTRQGVTDPLPRMQSNWLLKLDSHGCLVPGCHTVGVQEYALGLQGALHLAPNPVPAGAPLQLSFEPPAGYTPKGALRVVVLDALGKEAHAQTLGAATTSTALNMNLAAGLYYVHLTDGTSWLAGAKVVVE
ncbi:MAG: hypothetical protein KF797_09975 [Flavobacteriales bacterium]|nr:hypothetical protein [Flavobacteriales bacterium]